MASLLSLLDILGKQHAQQKPVDVSETPGPVKGPGGPTDDMIPAMIAPSQPGGAPQMAALSNGEFVFKAKSTAFMGDGNPDQGAQVLKILQDDPEIMDAVKTMVKRKYGGK